MNFFSYVTIRLNENNKETPEVSLTTPYYRLPNFSPIGEKKAKELWEENSLASHRFRYKSFIEYYPLPFNGKYTSINNEGYRYHDQIINPKKKYIYMFGGSTMYGGGSDDNNTIPALTDKILNNQFNVFNYGISGNNSRHELSRLINLVNTGAKTDIVIFYDGVNDIVNSCIGEGSVNTTINEKRIRLAIGQNFSNLDGLSYKEKLFDVFFQYTIQLVASFKDASDINLPISNSPCSDDKFSDNLAENIINNWKIAHGIVKGNGGNFFAILQPEANIGNPNINHLGQLKSLVKNKEFDDIEDNFYKRYKSFEKIYPLLIEKMKNYDFMFNMTEAFDRDEYIYIDHVHVTSNGNKIIANKISDLIKGINN